MVGRQSARTVYFFGTEKLGGADGICVDAGKFLVLLQVFSPLQPGKVFLEDGTEKVAADIVYNYLHLRQFRSAPNAEKRFQIAFVFGVFKPLLKLQQRRILKVHTDESRHEAVVNRIFRLFHLPVVRDPIELIGKRPS